MESRGREGESKHPSLPLARAERKPLDRKKNIPRATSAHASLKKTITPTQKQGSCHKSLPNRRKDAHKNGKNIAVIWGDCSSPEIVKQTLRVLDKVAEKYGHTFHYTDAAMGGEAIDKYGDPLPQHELDKCLAADSVLLALWAAPSGRPAR